MDQKKLFSVREIAREYGIKAVHISHQLRRGTVPLGVVVRFGPRRIYINREAWAAWIASGGGVGNETTSGKEPRNGEAV